MILMLLLLIIWLFINSQVMYNNYSSKKKQKVEPVNKMLKSFYSKQKSKTDNSPAAYKSISKEIKNEIKRVVRNCSKDEKTSNAREVSYGDNHLKYTNKHLDLDFNQEHTPKNYHSFNKKVSDRQVHSTKAGDSKNKELFTRSGRYDYKQIFERRREKSYEPEARTSLEKERNHHSFRPKKNNYTETRLNEDHTIKINERQREEYFNVKNFLTPDEFTKFGDRFPEKFKRVGLLGRGGFSVVWLGIHKSSKKKVAIKQILTKNPHETHLKQIWFGSYFFQKGGQPRQEFQTHIGINNLCKLYSHEIRSTDSWLYYELCGESLGALVFQLKGQSENNERHYQIVYKELVHRMREDHLEFKTLMVEICKALYLMNSHNIVHSDLKTENILIKTRKSKQEGRFIQGVKLIDFGSSFLFTNLKQFSMATPEYMPPEILNYILFQNKLEYDEVMLKKMEKYQNPWTIDIWSLGCILLEIISGVPLWMSLETRIQNTNVRNVGLFAVKNRVFSKIIQKQIEVISNIDYYIDNECHSGIKLRPEYRKIIKKMLNLDPLERISPFQVLKEMGISCKPPRIPFY